jgi:hypothetical protein
LKKRGFGGMFRGERLVDIANCGGLGDINRNIFARQFTRKRTENENANGHSESVSSRSDLNEVHAELAANALKHESNRNNA